MPSWPSSIRCPTEPGARHVRPVQTSVRSPLHPAPRARLVPARACTGVPVAAVGRAQRWSTPLRSEVPENPSSWTRQTQSLLLWLQPFHGQHCRAFTDIGPSRPSLSSTTQGDFFDRIDHSVVPRNLPPGLPCHHFSPFIAHPFSGIFAPLNANEEPST